MGKEYGAFLTIGELAGELGLPQHILRYWETRFPQLRPLQRAGNRRYYRPADVVLVRAIHDLLNVRGYTVRGAQQALSRTGDARIFEVKPSVHNQEREYASTGGELLADLNRIRAYLLAALEA
ncbi:MAG: MerR family transcriptional regulator [Sphingobium sp.]